MPDKIAHRASQALRFEGDVPVPVRLAACKEFVRSETLGLRTRHAAALKAEIEQALAAHGTAHWLVAIDAAGVPCGPINRLDQVYADPQVQARGLKINVPHPKAGSVPLVANPIKFSRTPMSYDTPPPIVGEHVEDVLRGLLRKSDAEIAVLREKKIL